jgi:hypothetical protein
MAVLVDGALQVVPFAMNSQKHLIEMPLVPRPGASAA